MTQTRANEALWRRYQNWHFKFNILFNIWGTFWHQNDFRIIFLSEVKDNLTAHNWQKWKKSAFLTCHCHEIYREDVVGLKSPHKYLKKLWFLWICEIWGNFVKNWYFVNNCLIKVRILKFFCTYVTHIIVIIWRTPHFAST